MFVGRSKAAFWATLLALLYGILMLVYVFDINNASEGDAEAIGAGIATVLIVPHMLITWLGIIFGMVGYFTKITGLQLTSGILYSVAGIFYLLNALFILPSIVLAFVGYSVQKKINLGTAQNPS